MGFQRCSSIFFSDIPKCAGISFSYRNYIAYLLDLSALFLSQILLVALNSALFRGLYLCMYGDMGHMPCCTDIDVDVISGEDGPTIGSTGVVQRIRTTGHEEEKKIFQSR